MKLGFIGSGKMAAALIKGVLKSGLCTPADITVSDVHAPSAEKLRTETGVTVAATNAEVVSASGVIVLAVKPGDALAAIQGVTTQQTGSPMRWASQGGGSGGGAGAKLLISIVAGLSIASLEKAAGEKLRVIRVMPNTPALVLAGASAFATGTQATDEDAAIAQRIFGGVGVALRVKESLLDAVTGLSGSGPAYVYTIIEALADGGVLMGLPRDLALQLAAKTVAGAAEMALQTGLHPAVLRDQVASPGGTTIAGLEALEAGGLRAALIAAVRAASERSAALGATK
ncbi:MAG: pyrroline-5-carboxylate reductase [Chthoniobacteraceae bacterium]